MNAKELAQKILGLFRSISSDIPGDLESLLSEALEEAFARGIGTKCSKHMSGAWWCSTCSLEEREADRRKAYLDAAKIADESCFCENGCKSKSDYHDIECNACDVAQKLRQKAGEI